MNMSNIGITTISEKSFQETIELVTSALQVEGFGVLTDIDMKATLKAKLDVDFPQYRILGACNPPFAYEALQAEALAGVFLPCNIVVRERGDHQIEVTAFDPVAAMQAVDNAELQTLALKIRKKLEAVIKSL